MRNKLSIIFFISLTSCFKNSNEIQENKNNSENQKNSFEIKKDSQSTSKIMKNNLKVLFLGDSYTIGQSVNYSDRWTSQLINKIKKDKNINILEKTIAQTGWTTGDLLRAISESKPENNYDFVYLLIGVNNQYQGLDKNNYKTEFKSLLNQAIYLSQSKIDHVFVISIPDWGVTPFAQGQSQQDISKEIDDFNIINKTEALQLKVNYIDITPVSKKASTDSSYNADDGLHPSKKMYEEWVKLIYPETIKFFN